MGLEKPKRQSLRMLLLLISFSLFPVTILYLSPGAPLMSLKAGMINLSVVVFLLVFLSGFVFEGLFVDGYARGVDASWLLVILGDIIRAWALYVFLKQVNRRLALLAAWFMLIHDAILGVSLVYLVQVPLLALGASSVEALNP
jgi:hypothetical protein